MLVTTLDETGYFFILDVTCIFMNATWYVHLFFSVTYRSTPVETLHTILLGICKYLFGLMTKRKEEDKKEILARMSAFNYSGFSTKVHGNVCYYYQSFVGRDFKGWMQMAIFIISSYLTEQRNVWLLMSKV